MDEDNIIATQAWRAVLETSINSNTSIWVGWEQPFEVWRMNMLAREGFVDPNGYLQNSDSLKKFVSNQPKPDPLTKIDLTYPGSILLNPSSPRS